jgi:hypothetical protein
VTDETIAEAELLRLVLWDERVSVTEFGCKGYELKSISVSAENGEAARLKCTATQSRPRL